MADLSTKTARRNLAPRPAPYFQKVGKGRFIGFRRGPDTWVARYCRKNGKQQHLSLGATIDYDDALRQAQEFFVTQGAVDARQMLRGTVRNALEKYMHVLREEGRDATADNAESRFKLLVWDDPLANIELEHMTREDFRSWRERIRDGRQNRTVNRHVRSIVAGLNLAIREQFMGNPAAWKLKPLADDNDRGEPVFLSAAQREQLCKAVSPECALFLQAIYLTGGRPREVASANKSDFDSSHGTLLLRHRKGQPAKPRPRTVQLSEAGIAFFKKQALGKLPAAPLLTDHYGKRWDRHVWSDAVQLGIQKHNDAHDDKLPVPTRQRPGASAYSFRHSRISELLQLYGIDPVTVAQQTGTSLKMLETYYFKFIATAMKDKLAAVDDG